MIKKVLLVSIGVTLSSILLAQPGGGTPPGGGDPVPIFGIEYLLIAGGAFGAYRIFRKKNQQGN